MTTEAGITVGELIKRLSEFPQDLRVVVDCLQDGGGYDLLSDEMMVKKLSEKNYSSSYSGALDDYQEGDETKSYEVDGKEKLFNKYCGDFLYIAYG